MQHSLHLGILLNSQYYILKIVWSGIFQALFLKVLLFSDLSAGLLSTALFKLFQLRRDNLLRTRFLSAYFWWSLLGKRHMQQRTGRQQGDSDDKHRWLFASCSLFITGETAVKVILPLDLNTRLIILKQRTFQAFIGLKHQNKNV